MRKLLLTFSILSIGLLMQPLQASVAPQSGANPDFDENGQVEFPDFLLFVGKFGSRQGDEKYEDRFDLDGDGEIGFGDFLILVSHFAKEVPMAVGTLDPVMLTVGDDSVMVDVSGNFSDANSDPLIYTAASDDEAIATASVAGSEVTISPVAAGGATITVTATDPGGLTATQTIAVTVEASNQTPVALDMEILGSIFVATVWSGHPVGFDLLTHDKVQFIAFYNADRKMTVGMRHLDEETWTLAQPKGVWLANRGRLSSEIGWDSHNSLTMAIDDDGHIHLCGNMHVDPLIYFRTTRPLDVTSFERVDFMVGKNEDRCTYPVFMRGPNNELIFRYRDGSSGDGVDYYNVYDVETKTWRRLHDTPLLDGLGRMNAYARGPLKGPDGMYHMVWMWRNTSDAATNHSISYARSRDLIAWETGGGDALDLPITIASGAIVDPVPPGGGLINMTQSLGFDDQKRAVISYHKHDEGGYTQAYCARLEHGEWVLYKVSDWTYRWEFGGGGSIVAEIRLGSVKAEADGGLSMSYAHVKEGRGIWKLHPQTLQVIGRYPPPENPIPDELKRVTSHYPGMRVNLRYARGSGTRPGERYVLRWETLGRNRDMPREKIPPPSDLILYILQDK